MRKRLRQYGASYLVVLLAAGNLFVWYAAAAEERRELTIAFLDVGQGDAIYIESPAGVRVLVDGGPGRSVLAGLGVLMPFYERSLDLIVVSNPDQDHIAGLVDVLGRYDVGAVLEPGTVPQTQIYDIFSHAVSEEGSRRILARRGMRIDLGRGVTLDILFPDREASGLSTNTGSIVAKLAYGETSVMLPGDTTSAIEEYLAMRDGERLDVDILKLAHHGSKTSSSDAFLSATTPDYAIISAGKENRYGHPHGDVLKRLKRRGVPVLATFKEGAIVFESDGVRLRRK